ncbi:MULTISPECIES: ABC transporter substrate-binding protein [Pseudomonadota]|nr:MULTISPECIES: ABC transporter substrate-binding protein [Chelativorans]
MKYWNGAVAAIAVLMLGASPSSAEDKPESIIVNTSGGENGPMLREAYFNDFEATTGIKIVDSSPADFGRLRAMVESGNVEYTVTEVESEDAWRAIEMNLLEPIDDEIVDRSKFPPQTLNPYLYPISSYSTVIGYSTEAFPEGGPTNWKEFWDVKTFPGPRSMRNHPIDNLEAALLADGVAPEDLYPLDLDRAFAKLDEIYPHVTTWWTTGAQQAQQLIDGEVVITTGYNSRLYSAIRKGAPIKMEFGGGILKAAAYAIPRGAPHAEWGQRFLATMAKPENQGKYALAFGLSGPDPDHVNYVPEDVRQLLPLHPDNLKKQVWMDQEWWLENGEAVSERWTEWMLSHN